MVPYHQSEVGPQGYHKVVGPTYTSLQAEPALTVALAIFKIVYDGAQSEFFLNGTSLGTAAATGNVTDLRVALFNTNETTETISCDLVDYVALQDGVEIEI